MLRWNLILIGGPIGLVTGLMAWLATGGASAGIDRATPLATAVSALRAPPPRLASPREADVAALTATPIFALTVGPGAVKEPTVRLEGVSISRRRTAALVAIDGRPSEWLGIGDSRDGVTLEEVRSSRIVVDTIVGPKEIALGEQSGPGPAEATLESSRGGLDQSPPAFRAPPPPASAPK